MMFIYNVQIISNKSLKCNFNKKCHIVHGYLSNVATVLSFKKGLRQMNLNKFKLFHNFKKDSTN